MRIGSKQNITMEVKTRQRVGLSVFFFTSGLCFSSWASRIPSIKTALDLNEAELGSLLFVMPISSLIGLPISGWLVEKFDSRWPIFWGFLFHGVFIFFIGMADSVFLFTTAIFLFAFTNRITNIAMNTQAITLQKNFEKKINGSLHGLWSLGGIAGIGITTAMVALKIDIATHFLAVGALVMITTFFMFRHLLTKDRSTSGARLTLKKPDPLIMYLGIVILMAAICEGGMFDWSGLYFKEVVKVEIFTTGYLVFMTSMALSRFASDWFIQRLGMPRMFVISAVLITIGMSLAILFPTFWVAMIGFTIVGAGTASVVPMTFILAGTSTKYSPGMAISLIGTYAMVGILAGPPLIGYIAHLTSLRVSFIFLALAGVMIIPVSKAFFRAARIKA